MKFAFLSVPHHHARACIERLRAIPGAEVQGIADEDAARGARFPEQHGTTLFLRVPVPPGMRNDASGFFLEEEGRETALDQHP